MAQVKPVNKKKMSGPALAATIVSIVILIALVVSLAASSGLFVRVQKGASTENFEINGSMLSYFTNSYYQNWYQNYYYYILFGYIDFDPTAPLDEQYTDEKKTQTYYDMFTEGATKYVEQILKYCEAAKADPEVNFTEMEEEAEQYAKDSIASLKKSANENNIDFITYIRTYFGKEVSENDLRKALVLEHIASDYSTIMHDRIYESMTDTRKEQYFKDNLSSFISAEYLQFSLSQTVTPETVDPKKYENGEKDPAYLEAVEKAQADAKKLNDMNKIADKEFIDKLAKAESAEEFKRYLLEYKFDECFTSAYDAAKKSWVDSDKPSDEDLNAYKELIKKAVIDATLEEKTNIDLEEINNIDSNTTNKWEKAKKTLPASVITKLKSVITSATKTGSYNLDNDLSKFLFAGVKAEYGIEYGEKEEKGENAKVGEYWIDDMEITDEDKLACGNYTLTVSYVTKSAYRDETILRNVGHILFQVDETGETEGTYKTSEEAKAAAEKVLAEIKATEKNGVVEKDVFETFGKEHTNDSNVFYEDVNKGDMLEEFEEWLFAAKTVGEIGLVETEYGWHIMFYNGESVPAWQYKAHNSATSADLEDWYNKLEYKVTINSDLYATILNK